MERNKIQERVLKLLEIAPEIKKIIVSEIPISEKRKKIRSYLSDRLYATFEDDSSIPDLEWILCRDAVNVMKNILSERNERLAGFSFLSYLCDLATKTSFRGIERPDAGFFHELEHLLRCIVGKAGIYPEKLPAFLKYHGRKASRLRSNDLSRMARGANKWIDRYRSGIEEDIIKTRQENVERILDFFHAKPADWDDWKWHTRHIIRDADVLQSLVELRPDEIEAVKLARKNKIPFGITPYYLSLFDRTPDRKNDYAVRAQVIPSIGYVNKMIEARAKRDRSMDFMLESDTSPISGITRRYPKICILKPILTCPQICVYCQRNWEIEDVYNQNAFLSSEALERAIQWIESVPEITEVLITGGDPLLLSDEKIIGLLDRLSSIAHIERIRIGTRTPVTLPHRITDDLVSGIKEYFIPGKRDILIVTHFEHMYEITPESIEAVQKFKQNGIDVFNQMVFTFFNSRKFEAAAIRNQLHRIGVTPYYTFNTKGKEETNEYRVPIARLLQEHKEEARVMPGSVRTDRVVFNVPRLGKNEITAAQHHDVISILPNGRRVFEFHPWEKKLALMNTYVYTDVSIHDYLQRLKLAGEDISHYRNIWYYY